MKINDEEYCLEAAVVQDLVEEVLLGRDVPLCKHMVKCLPQEEQMGLPQQLARDNRIQLEGRPKKDGRSLTVVIRSQKKRAQSQERTQDAIKSREETQENAVESQEETQKESVKS